MTRDTRRLASTLLTEAEDHRFSASELRQATRMHNARLYPLLEQWLDRGWITDDYDPSPHDAPEQPQPLHYYLVTELGRRELARMS